MKQADRERVLRERAGMTRHDLSDAVYAAILDLTATEVDLAAARRERDAARAEAARLRELLREVEQVARGAVDVSQDSYARDACAGIARVVRAALAAADMAPDVTAKEGAE